MDPSLQMRGQSPMNCPVSDVKMWGQNLTYCLMTKEKAALIHTLMLLLTNTKLQRTFQYTRKNLIVFLPEMPTTWKKQGPHRGHWFFCGFPHIQLSLKLA